mmetsp:Transcript_5831/g.13116  ORF Transcript_5831/g.13116 Transcript_5831/m.13116 type:complete len:111 (+) Transcript_5831:100-432(+)
MMVVATPQPALPNDLISINELETAEPQQQQQQQYHQPAPPTFAMYPQMSGGVPTVQLGLHPHHGGVQPQVGGAPPPAAPGNSGATAPGGEGKRSSPQPAISDGGHLAHCA